MDFQDKLIGPKITQQLAKQAEEKGAYEFFKPPNDLWDQV